MSIIRFVFVQIKILPELGVPGILTLEPFIEDLYIAESIDKF